MTKEAMRDHINVLYSDSEMVGNISDNLNNIRLLSEKSVIGVRKSLNKALEKEPENPSGVDYALLRSNALDALAVLNAMNFMFEIAENSAHSLESISEEISSIATIISDDCETQRE